MLTTHFVANDSIAEPALDSGLDLGPEAGLQSAYYDIGEGETFVLLHGFSGAKLDFHDQLPWLAKNCRVLAYDQRGHGESSNLGPYSLEGLTADLIGFLNALNIDRCHILGHSLGGMVVLRSLLAHPERFSSAILMDTGPSAVSSANLELRKQLNSIVLEHGCEALLAGMQEQIPSDDMQRVIDHLGEQENWRRIRARLTQMDPCAFVELGKALSEQQSILANLTAIQIPTTIICGALDKPYIEPSTRMHSHIPNSVLVSIANAGHSPQYENAAGWQAAIASHFSWFDEEREA